MVLGSSSTCLLCPLSVVLGHNSGSFIDFRSFSMSEQFRINWINKHSSDKGEVPHEQWVEKKPKSKEKLCKELYKNHFKQESLTF